MSTAIIIIVCLLLLLAYLFDVSSVKTKIPSVILLLGLGWSVGEAAQFLRLDIPDLAPVLPIIGTIGLILIVLDGALELELNKSKLSVIKKSTLMSLIPLLVFSFALAFAIQYWAECSFKIALANAIPFAIISSAIAIPSAKNLIAGHKEFITYESSLSDIFGVILFNFVTLNDNIGTQTVEIFLLQIIIMILLSFVLTLLLAYLISRVKSKVKFTPIIILIILVYTISKVYHLPSLVFILIFGLLIGNLDELKRYKLIEKLKPDILDHEVFKFKDITSEMTFLVRALFFLLFGFLIHTSEIINIESLPWALIISVSIFVVRSIFLFVFKLPQNPLVFFAPRGLITVLLYLSIPLSQQLPIISKSLIIQVIIISSIIMMFGLMQISENASELEKEINEEEK